MKEKGTASERDSFLEKEIEKYRKMNTKSGKYWQEACHYLPGGSTRSISYFQPFSPYVVKGGGCRVKDMDGNERIDFFCNATSLILGHANPGVVKAIQDQVQGGTAYTFPTEREVELAKMLCERVPSVERVRFCNSGSEGTMYAIRTARAFTGKNKIAKMEGGYQGSHDFAEVSVSPSLSEAGDPLEPKSVPDSLGVPPSIMKEIVVLPYNNLDAIEKIVKKHQDDLAGIMVEPVLGRGYIPPAKGFLEGLREITRRYNMLLIFDEVQTFRLAPGGAQQFYGVAPDITAFGKIIGGGLPVGAFGGKAEIMALYDHSGAHLGKTVTHHGTFNGNPLTMAAGVATLSQLNEEVYKKFASQGAYIRQEIKKVCDQHEVTAQVTGEGSLFKVHFNDQPVYDYRSCLKDDKNMEQRMFYFFMNRGIYIEKSARLALSTPIGDKETQHFLGVLDEFFEGMKA